MVIILGKDIKCKQNDLHELSKKCAESIVVAAMEKKSNDNLTIIFISLPGLLDYLTSKNKEDENKILKDVYTSYEKFSEIKQLRDFIYSELKFRITNIIS